MSEMTSEGLLTIVTIIGFVALIVLLVGFIGALTVSPDALQDPQNASFITKMFLSLRSVFVPIA